MGEMIVCVAFGLSALLLALGLFLAMFDEYLDRALSHKIKQWLDE